MINLIGFFTKIPGGRDIEKASKETYLLPLISLIISIPPALFFYFFNFIPKIILSILSIIFLYSITGLLHLDGLADFSDGVMAKGDREKKIRALKDVNTGIAALFSTLIVILLETFSLYSIKVNIFNVLTLFIISELSAKFSMMGGLLNKPKNEGLGSLFQKNFKFYYLIIGIIITLPLILYFNYFYFFSFIGFLVSLTISIISLKNFGFVNGDVLGAMNEISRAITMVILCMVL